MEKKICLDLLYLLKRRYTWKNGSLKSGILFKYHHRASQRICSSGLLIQTLITYKSHLAPPQTLFRDSHGS